VRGRGLMRSLSFIVSTISVFAFQAMTVIIVILIIAWLFVSFKCTSV